MDNQTLFTIGHSTHSFIYFLEILKQFSINCVIDVRSIAASHYNPQFNKEYIQDSLNANAIQYLHFAKEFGARRSDPGLLDEEGKVDFEKVRQTQDFLNGIQKLKIGLKQGYTIALLCSESDPLQCHRFSMICPALEKEGFQIYHILKDKTLKTNVQLKDELLKKYKNKKQFPQPSLFEPDISLEHQLSFSYRLTNKEIAYTPLAKERQEKYG